ncbi:glycosyltransferase family 2 protein [Desulfosediminicola flagellatus]|uniref:glycosyltransferase family 2 protein n=1 Tax=Desulfosediminicola flagellatus TaxID=2569541 RepID=UPI0010AB5A9D|nr:glycosyltransferase family A protein [Desulfosediminicola flagellatus]
MAKVSVIIPCFNHGAVLSETLESVYKQVFSDIEIIVVNDGSSDAFTRQMLGSLSHPDLKVIHTENQGLAAARNNGISAAEGEYILPLDADDCIGPEYIEKAVAVLGSNPDIGIVYCRAQLFGAVDTEWLLPEYSLRGMLKDNLIFCSALFRRRDWEEVGGYDPGMIYGWEDYDFWLSLIEKGKGVHQIPEILFYYRVASDSMIRSKEKWQKVSMLKRIYERHKTLFSENIDVWIEALLDANENYYTSRLYVDCGEGVSDERSVSRKVEQGTSTIDFQLNDYENIQRLRFDPIDTPAIIEMLKVTLKYQDDSSRTVYVNSDNALIQLGNDRYFADDDPQCFLDVSPEYLVGAASLNVQLSFKSLGSDALASIVEYQNQNLTDLKQFLRTTANIGALKAFFASLKRHQNESFSQYVLRQCKFF